MADPGDRDEPRQAPERRAAGSEGRPGCLVPWLVVLVAASSLLWFHAGRVDVRTVDTSRFLEAVRAGAFERVEVGPDWIQGTPLAAHRHEEDVEDRPWRADRPPEDERLVALLEEKGVAYDYRPDSDAGWLFLFWAIPLSLLAFYLLTRWMALRGGPARRDAGGVLSFGKTTARVHVESDTGVTFGDVAGIEEAVEELREIVDFLRTPERYQRLGGSLPRGVLLVGPPGTGKTLLARAVAGEAGVPFFSLSGSEFVEMFVGVGAARVRDLFAQAQRRAPAIIFIDELDALGRTRAGASVQGGGTDEREQTLHQLLNEMDGFDTRRGLVVLSATNRPEILDPALLRPGRFDRQVLVDRPDRIGRLAILRVHARRVKLDARVDLDQIAAGTPGFVGSDLANLVNEAALLAARRGAPAVEGEDLENAIERLVAGLERRSRRLSELEKRVVAYHEAGHALVHLGLENADPVQKVSIIPRGMGALGYTLQRPLEDRHLLRRRDLDDRLAGLLGGRAAEEIVFGEISTGAADDLRQATGIARAMVADYGMSEAIGPVSLGDRRRSAFLTPDGDPYAGARPHGDRLAALVDDEVARLVTEALERARTLLLARRDALERIAGHLIEHEVADRPTLEALAAAVLPTDPPEG